VPEAAIDRARLDEIGSPELVHELTQIFLEDMAWRLQALADAHAAGEDLALERGAHAVKGACGNFGARRMASLAEALERVPRAESDEAGAAIVSLRAEFERVRRELALAETPAAPGE
jgi:HPt (histidine-containing phosphotransfer) domain-containing protein